MNGLVRRIGDFWAGIAAGGLNLLFPPRCAYCRIDIAEPEDRLPICESCRRLLVPEHWVGCRHCGGAILGDGESSDNCPSCNDPPLLFDRAVVLGRYQNEVREVVLKMKHPRNENLSLAMGKLLGQNRFFELAEIGADMIVPVPMYWSRRWKRGTNSAELLARCLGRKLGLPVWRRLLVRCKNTSPQAGLSPKMRFSNMRGAFRVRSEGDLHGRRILLVDDVLTTGATCSEAAKALKKAGAAMVAVAVVARAQGGE
jgi:ComF family protein